MQYMRNHIQSVLEANGLSGSIRGAGYLSNVKFNVFLRATSHMIHSWTVNLF